MLQDTFERTGGAPSVLVATDRFVGSSIATRLSERANVSAVSDAETVADRANVSAATVGDVIDGETLAAANAEDADLAIVALTCDRQTMLVAQLLRVRFGVDHVTVLVDDPELCEVFDGIATAAVPEASMLVPEICREVETALSVPVDD